MKKKLNILKFNFVSNMLRKYMYLFTYWYEIILKYIQGLTLAFMGDIEFCPVNDGLESKGLESLLDMGGKLASLFLLIDGV